MLLLEAVGFDAAPQRLHRKNSGCCRGGTPCDQHHYSHDKGRAQDIKANMPPAPPGNAYRACNQPAQGRDDPIGKGDSQHRSDHSDNDKLQDHRPPDLPSRIPHGSQRSNTSHLRINMIGNPEFHHYHSDNHHQKREYKQYHGNNGNHHGGSVSHVVDGYFHGLRIHGNRFNIYIRIFLKIRD